jgi:EAL domain-containing protein (putative c-di-GMP-specific phosphodiesterase class I)
VDSRSAASADGDSYPGLLADRLLAALARPVRVDDLSVAVGVSLGIALQGVDGFGLERLLRAADRAMYDAKRSTVPGNRRTARTAWSDRSRDEQLEDEIPAALERDELLLHYQPQLARDGTVAGFEALIRWQHPALGLLRPHQFLPAAEDSGLLSRVTLRAVELALADQPRLARVAGPEVTVSVNVAARDLLGRDFLADVTSVLRAAGVPPHRLILEITEPPPRPAPSAVDLFAGLARLGVAVSIHEFGAGKSSLTALSHYPGVREVKIDPSLVRRVRTDDRVDRLVRAIVSAAHGFEVEVVAEGIEDAATVAHLRDVGCDRLQGFWLGPPADLTTVTDWVVRWPGPHGLLTGPPEV